MKYIFYGYLIVSVRILGNRDSNMIRDTLGKKYLNNDFVNIIEQYRGLTLRSLFYDFPCNYIFKSLLISDDLFSGSICCSHFYPFCWKSRN